MANAPNDASAQEIPADAACRSVGVPAARVELSQKARGALGQPQGRFERWRRTVAEASAQEAVGEASAPEELGENWSQDDEVPPMLETTVTEERARSIIASNDSPDISFEQSINPYRGCEHGCIYCYARPSHAYLELSPGLDFETKLFAKVNAAELLRMELSRRGYVAKPIALGANTDCYQPAERSHRITRQILEILAECEHPLTIVTKSALVERDLDLLAPMARKNLVSIFVSISTLDRALARRLEPRAASPQRRLDTLRALSASGVPCGVMVAPVIPALSDKSIEEVLEAAAAAGATMAGYTLLRLPNELKQLFRAWLAVHYPLRAAHIMSIVQQLRGGRDNDSQFGARMTGTGPFADLISQRFEIACRRLGLNDGRERPELDTTRFRPPSPPGQLRLF